MNKDKKKKTIRRWKKNRWVTATVMCNTVYLYDLSGKLYTLAPVIAYPEKVLVEVTPRAR